MTQQNYKNDELDPHHATQPAQAKSRSDQYQVTLFRHYGKFNGRLFSNAELQEKRTRQHTTRHKQNLGQTNITWRHFVTFSRCLLSRLWMTAPARLLLWKTPLPASIVTWQLKWAWHRISAGTCKTYISGVSLLCELYWGKMSPLLWKIAIQSCSDQCGPQGVLFKHNQSQQIPQLRALLFGTFLQRKDVVNQWSLSKYIFWIDDRLYSAILRSREQTHCARMWFYMSD